MAHMYPDPINPDTRSRAEIRLYEAFRDQLPNDFAVFHSVAWQVRDTTGGVRDGEADFCLAHSDTGILIIEVKGGGIHYDGQRGQWYSNQFEIKDPFQQGRTAKYSLLEKLKEQPYWSNRWTTIGYAVAFPDVVIKDDLRLDAPRELILDASDIADVHAWVNRATAYLRGQRPDDAPLGRYGVEELVALLSPTWDLHLSLSVEIEEEHREMVRLTEQQFAMLDFLARQRRAAISGCAGSGKTTLAYEKARRLADQGFDVLLTCFNKALAEYLVAENPHRNLQIAHFHRFADEFVHKAGITTGPYTSEYFNDILPEQMMEATDILGPQFDAIIVDEGQDFRDNWWIPLQCLLRQPDAGIFYVFFDDNQTIYRSKESVPLELAPFSLTRNCRNTQAIHEIVMQFYRSDQMPTSQGPKGRAVELHTYSNQASLKRLLSRTLHRLVTKEEIWAEDIVILTPKAQQHSWLWKLGPVGNFHITDQWVAGSNEIFCSTVYAFKGLESPIVILAEIEAGMRNMESLLYVGCSRACNHLIVLAPETLPEETKSKLAAH
ncbi:MAG: NERD domain-containing protein [Anaerolineae bacterium]|nr:NERD domain-containing protein [Anaerolineae bacterium]